MKKLYALLMLASSILILGQTGMGTPTPRGALDINRPLTNTFGLVLPTNDDTAKMLNPQGGTIAVGTMMYDSADKCVKYFDGTNWSNCLGVGAPSNLATECNKVGFRGTFESGTALNGAIFSITIKNNGTKVSKNLNFQTSDLVLSGVRGTSVSSVSQSTATISAGQSVTITYRLSGIPTGYKRTTGTLTGTWSNDGLTCTTNVTVNSGKIRIGYFGSYAIGAGKNPAFNSQLQNDSNYGSKGKYNKIKGFVFTDIGNTLATLTVDDLQENYDIISVDKGPPNTPDNAKLKAFADAGGVVFVQLENNSDYLLTTFGFTGSFAYGGSGNVTTNTNSINSGIFGSSINTSIMSINGGAAALLTVAQLPANSTILATAGTDPRVFIAGSHGNIIFFWDEDVHYHTSVSGTDINTPQEIFLHNLMAYALDNL
ncbi:hypothetical protein B4N84_05135 [Flavobacterium sp. IR1]|nr:hypothetical protein B4N84_05135 [Flavobacterium sp. IR1]